MSVIDGTGFIPLPKFIYSLQIWQGNYFLDFKEAGGGAERTAQIDAGYYLPEALATALQSALNGASGASGDYTVSFSRSTEKFTISTDLAYLDLLWNTGTNAASGAATALGFAASADSTGATAYEAPAALPNLYIPTQPIRNARPEFEHDKKEAVSDSGVRVINFRKIMRFLTVNFKYIEEQEIKNEWIPFIGNDSAARGHPFDFYPDSQTNANYIRMYAGNKRFRPRELLNEELPAFYQFDFEMVEKKPVGGTISLEDIFTRTVT